MSVSLLPGIGYADSMSPAVPSIRHSRPLQAALLTVAGIVVFVLAALASAYGLERTRELTDRRSLGYQSLGQVEAVLSGLKDLETGQRGFLITGDETFLEPYLEARRSLDARYGAMRSGMGDVILAEGFWQRLDKLVQERVRIAERNIGLKRQGLFNWDADHGRLSEGKRAMDAIREQFNLLEDYRRRQIADLTDQLEEERRLAFGITFGAGFLGLGMMVSSLALFLREQRRRLEAEAVLASANQRLETDIQARTADLQAALERIRAFAGELDQGIEAERRRLAREVHDQIGQIFTALKLLIRPWQEHFADNPRLQEQMESFTRLLDQGVNTARRITAELQPPLLEDLGLGAALEHYFGKFGGAGGLACRVEVQYDHVLGRAQATALFRIAQEALTNILRHAGASRVIVGDRLEDLAYRLIIEDDGRGFGEDARPSFGLRGMEERAKLAGGTVNLSSAGEGGVRVEIILPVTGANSEKRP